MTGDLARAIRERECILFAGAGVSMTVGLPSWRTLMEHMGAQLGFIFLNAESNRQSSKEPSLAELKPMLLAGI